MKKVRARNPENVTIEIIEKAIRCKSRNWHGNCYAIACKIVESGLVKGRPVYGHWFGKVAKTGYWADRRNQPFQRHGWVELDDGRILDPTRWSFEDEEPYVYIAELTSPFLCNCGHVTEEHEHGFFRKCSECECLDFETESCEYDEGGNRLRMMTKNPPPQFHKSDKVVHLEMRTEARLFMMGILGQPQEITVPMVFWLGNLSLQDLGPFAKDIYKSLVNAGWSSVIPIDNRMKVLGRGKN